MRRPALSCCVLSAAALLTVGLVPAVVPAASPADAAKSRTTTTRLAPGVTLTHSPVSYQGPQRIWTLRVRLDAHTRLQTTSPGNVVGARRMTGLALARQEKAVAGINGDTFYFFDPAAVPRGGMSRDGRIVKSALVGKNAVLYVTRDGRAAVGNPGFRGKVYATDARGKQRSFKITSVNSIENAENGGMTLVDPLVLTSSLQKPPGPKRTCAVVQLTDLGANRYRVGTIAYNQKRFTRAGKGTHALISCAGATKTWIRSALVRGSTITATAGYAVSGITTLLSGNRQLVRNGKRYDDRTGLNVYGNKKKPETFGCVLADRRTVLLGVVEGDRPGRTGMTYSTLTSYLLARKCRSALVFDGSGSSTLVAKRPGRALAVQNLMTAPGGVRALVNGLFVVRR